MIKILFLASDPTDSNRLRLGQELRDVREKLQLAKQRDTFSLESRESVRPRDISQAIFDVDPQIVHFSGHGTNSGELCFEDLSGKLQLVQPNALASLFELVAMRVRCVILNACYSSTQAEAIANHIPFVIGMNRAIGDEAAIAFAVGFYKALGAGRSFEEAYKFGCVELKLEGIPEDLTPVLHTKEQLCSEDKLIDISQSFQENSSSTVTFTLVYTETGVECRVKAPSNIRARTCIERLISKVAKLSPESRFLQNFDMYDWILFVRNDDSSQRINSLRKISSNVTLQAAQIHTDSICELHAEIKQMYGTIQANKDFVWKIRNDDVE